jgi:hypothetical protein
MMGRFRGVLGLMAGFFLVAGPAVGTALLTVASFFRRRPRMSVAWLLVWVGLALPTVAGLARGELVLKPLYVAAVGVVFGSILTPPRGAVLASGVAVGFAVVLVFGFAEREASRRMWNDAVSPQTLLDLVRGRTRLSGDSPGWTRNGVRRFDKEWWIDPGGSDLRLTLEARRVDGASGWQWYSNHPATRQERRVDDGETFTRIERPAGYLVQRVRMPEAVAGLEASVSLWARGSAAASSDGCGLELRTFEPAFRVCSDIEITPDWTIYELDGRFPSSAVLPAFEVRIDALDLEYLDIRDVDVFVRRSGTWEQIAAPEPAGVTVRVPIPGWHVFRQPTLQLTPDDEWRSHTLDITGADIAGLDELSVILQVEAGLAVEIRSVRLETVTQDRRQPVARPGARSDLWFEQANLAGHTFATAGLLAVLLAPTVGTGVVVWVSAVATVFLTGSRAAWLAILMGGMWLMWLRGRRRHRLALAAAVATLGLVLVSTGVGDRVLGRLLPSANEVGNSVSRTEIWEVAVDMFAANPATGTAGLFSSWWRDVRPDDPRPVPTHAHSLSLQYAAAYGVPGLVAAMWLQGALVLLAWRRRRWQGVAFIVPILLLSVVDYTLFYVGVLTPMILGLNVNPQDVRRSISAS